MKYIGIATAGLAGILASTNAMAADTPGVLVPAPTQDSSREDAPTPPEPAAAPSQPAEMFVPAPVASTRKQIVLPVNTLVLVTPAEEITSKKMKEGTTREFLVVEDVVQDGVVIIPRGSPVTATVTWRTGKGIVGKSAKFELTFERVRVNGRDFALRGSHRQEGRGNTAGALLGSMIITGRSAVMPVGQVVNVFTKEPIAKVTQ
ncbi:hypothetical protein [Erythrobacter sp. SG61-1L]|uniref:hypothetical protein n=1 Tax=Erythrobacter sp. SG61-1L TaxID=1603897 RepID=UPI0006C8EB1B|nr:hypothetical protein [Erythrobacter sp. SG61-1L]